MKNLKTDNYIWQMLLGAFFLSGFLHVVLYGVPYMDSIVQIFDGTVVICWMITILKRIVDRKVRNYMVAIAVFMAGYFVIQMCKYKIYEEVTALRYTWYCFYIPMTMIPMCLFFIAIFMNREEGNHDGRKWYLLLLPCLFIILSVFTNDFHGLVFGFPDGLAEMTGRTGTYTLGPLYYVMIFWQSLLVILAVIFILRKCGTTVAKRQFWLPAASLLVGTFLMFLGLFDLFPKVCGINVWQLTEIYIFTMILFLEGCIQIGMIPANTGYEKMFGLVRLPIAIYDLAGKEKMTSATPIPKEEFQENVKIETMDIYGGKVAWAVDLTPIRALNQQIMEVTSQIESRNERLLSENQMKEEQASLDARNQLYDQIAGIVKSQLTQVEHLLEDSIEEDFEGTIAKINVYNAYIKRRSNMELLKADKGSLLISELGMAIRESMEHLKDTGVIESVRTDVEGELPADMIISAYESFQKVLETYMETAEMVAVFLTYKDHVLQIRMMVKEKNGPEYVETIQIKEGGKL